MFDLHLMGEVIDRPRFRLTALLRSSTPLAMLVPLRMTAGGEGFPETSEVEFWGFRAGGFAEVYYVTIEGIADLKS